MDFLRRSSRHSKVEKVRNIEIRRQMNYQESIIDYIQRKQLDMSKAWTIREYQGDYRIGCQRGEGEKGE